MGWDGRGRHARRSGVNRREGRMDVTGWVVQEEPGWEAMGWSWMGRYEVRGWTRQDRMGMLENGTGRDMLEWGEVHM